MEANWLKEAKKKIWIPLDVNGLRDVGRHIRDLDGSVGVFKTGLQLIHRVGTPKLVKYIRGLGVPSCIFVDAKLDDIPNTVGEATAAIADQGVEYINLHASAGPKAIDAAVEKKKKSLILIVTVLTSLTPRMLYDMYVACFPGAKNFDSLSEDDQNKYLQEVVLRMAIMAAECGADGVICSPQELSILSEDGGLNGMLRYTPGIRPRWAAKNDQERITTPAEAISMGASGIIVGRPVLQPPKEIGKPIDAANRIAEEIAAVMAGK